MPFDWKYEHFDQEAVFDAPREILAKVASDYMTEFLQGWRFENTTDGFIMKGESAWHGAIATFHIEPSPVGTKVTVNLLVERAGAGGFMLIDIGGYYHYQIRKWLRGIAQRLGNTNAT
jgi:hypothetical protein